MGKKNFLLIVLSLSINIAFGQQKPEVYESSNKFSSMWWLNSVADPKISNYTFAVQSSDYGMLFNYSDLKFEGLWINKEQVREADFLASKASNYLQHSKGIELSFGTMNKKGGDKTTLEPTGELADCQLHSAGRYAQKRFIKMLSGDKTAQTLMSGLEVFNYTDFFSLIYAYRPEETTSKRDLYMDFKFPDNYDITEKHEDYIVVKGKEEKSGFVVFPSKNSTEINVEKGMICVANKRESFTKDKDYQVGLAIYPFIDINASLDNFIKGKKAGLKITANQTVPSALKLDPKYNEDKGTYEIRLTRGTTPRGVLSSDINESIDLEITNNSDASQVARLDMYKIKDGASITGLSGVLCDVDGTPTGIPVQITKNWHYTKGKPQKYEGSWMRLYTNVTVPANTTLKFKFKYIAAYWGQLAQASHAQLCIIGWGSTVQNWEQSAVGSWGESICYSPEGNIGNSNITDLRASFMKNYENTKCFQWAGNVGGGDLLNITGGNGLRLNHQNIRTKRTRYAPNLSEVIYQGEMADGAIDFEYTAMLARTNDMVKGRYHIKMKVNKTVNFTNFAVFAAAAYRYYFGYSERAAHGNDEGMKREWRTARGINKDGYIGIKMAAEGNNPWYAQTTSHVTMSKPKNAANRGIILRDWDATINGEKETKPYWGEYMLKAKSVNSDPKSIAILTLPPDATRLKAGDYIDATVELAVYQLDANHYCGDNEEYKKYLTEHPDSWDITMREAQQNDPILTMKTGNATRKHPMRIEAANNLAEGEILGGLAFEPITFTGLTAYRNPILEISDDGNSWTKVDQSKEGNDFWQTDFNADTKRWEITYNIPLDRADYTKARHFRFRLN